MAEKSKSKQVLEDSRTQSMSPFPKQEIKDQKVDCSKFSLLVVGKTGAGKSSLLNAFADTDFFKSAGDRSTPGTKDVCKYEFVKNGVTITVWDSPGFEDCSGNEEQYKAELRLNCSNVDVVLFCISLKQQRADLGQDASSLKQVTAALGVDVWKKAAIVLTFANMLQKRLELEKRQEDFTKRLGEWKGKVQQQLHEYSVGEDVVTNIPVIPAGHFKRKHLPEHDFWLSQLWFKVYVSVKDDRFKRSIKKATQGRFVSEKHGQASSPTAIVITSEYAGIAAASEIVAQSV